MASPDRSNPAAGEAPDQLSRTREQAGDLHYRRIVVKAGTGVLTSASDGRGLDLDVMGRLAHQISQLKRELSADVVLVTSGAIAAGWEALDQGKELNLGRDIPSRQVLAAIGQTRLMHTYQAASAALSVGTTIPRSPAACAAAIAIESAPLVGRVLPSSATSPTTAN